MNSKAILSAAIVAALAAGGPAFAQGYGHGRDEQNRHEDRGHDFQPDRHQDDRYRANDREHDSRGAGPYHHLHRGEHLPSEYRNRQYVVDNWRHHHLQAPPRGYHWVQTGADYVLVAIASGVIAQIVLGQ